MLGGRRRAGLLAVIQALRTHIQNTDRICSNASSEAQRTWCASCPSWTNWYGQLPAPGPNRRITLSAFDSTTDFLRRMAADTPMVLILDDLHSADTPSILLLRFVARELATCGWS